jgi:hypothetical protein
MRDLIIGTITGLFLGIILAGSIAIATAQAPTRIFGTNASTGAPVAIGVTGAALNVACQ